MTNDQRIAKQQADRALHNYMEAKASVEQTDMTHVPKFGNNEYGERIFISSRLVKKS